MPRAFFDIMADGEIAVYPAEQFAVWAVDAAYWVAKNLELPLEYAPTRAAKALIPFGDFHPDNKLQKFIRQRVGEIRLDGTYVIPFRFAGKKGVWSQFSLAGVVFFPDGHWHRGHHFDGPPKEIANLAFRVMHSYKSASHPVVVAARESFREKEASKPPHVPTREELDLVACLKAAFGKL